MKNSTERFTDTVLYYIKYRPSYPKAVLQLMVDQCNLNTGAVIADIGSGTGLLSLLFLEYGNVVYGVEPNQAMREAAEKILAQYPKFHSVNGSAEATSLADASVDFITAGTAFHWFDFEKTKIEFKRILKKKGFVLLVWNVRDVNEDFVRDYENLLLQYNTDYEQSNAKKFNKTAIKEFFAPHKMHRAEFPNHQMFDWEGLKGRLLSASYSLRPSDPQYQAMIDALRKIYDKYEKDGKINFLYKTKLYFGRLDSSNF